MADPRVTASEIQACLKKYLESVNSKDIWATVVPPVGGPRKWHWKTRPCAGWMAKTAGLIFELLEVARNGKIHSRKLCVALDALLESGDVKNTSGAERAAFVNHVDITIRILFMHFRTCKRSKSTRQTVLSSLQGTDRCKAGEGGGRTVRKIGL